MRISKSNLVSVAVTIYVLLGGALVINYGYQRSENQQTIAKVSQLTNEITMHDSHFRSEVLRNMFVFYYSYDALNDAYQTLQNSVLALQTLLTKLAKKEMASEQVLADFQHYQLQLTTLAQKLDTFRSDNATSKNSFIYLMQLLESRAEGADFTKQEFSQLYFILANIIQMRATMDTSLLPLLSRRNQSLCQADKCQNDADLISSFYLHTQYFLDNYPNLIDVYQELISPERMALLNNIQQQQLQLLEGDNGQENLQFWLIIVYLFVTVLLMLYFWGHQKKYLQLSRLDNLTQLDNRQSYEFALNRAFRSFVDHDKAHFLALIDIDHFKQINDNHGHALGDEVLKEVVDILKQNTRHKDGLFRYGGEEFAIISTNVDNIERQLERIRKAVECHRFDDVEQITISIGATNFREEDSKSKIFKRADYCLYQAKDNGRNQVNLDLV